MLRTQVERGQYRAGARKLLLEVTEWPGQPVTAHWGVEDPAAAAGDDDAKRAAFLRAFSVLRRRINLLVSLHPTALDRVATKQEQQAIGETR